jgi:thioesterase domain-containing protein
MMNSKLEINLDLTVFFDNPNIEALNKIIAAESDYGSALNLAVVALQSRATTKIVAPPLFYVHPLGGFGMCYAEMAGLLGPAYPFYVLQSPGVAFNSTGGSWVVESIESLARRYIQSLKDVEPKGPYHLGGWSFGGIVAFEMARQLQTHGDRVLSLALIDTKFTNSPAEQEDGAKEPAADSWDDAELLGRVFMPEGTTLTEGSSEERFGRMRDAIAVPRWLPQEAEIAYARRIAGLVRAHLRAANRYVPARYDGRVTIFRSLERDEKVSRRDLPALESIATEGVDVYGVPGSHTSIIKDKGAVAIAQWYMRDFPTRGSA